MPAPEHLVERSRRLGAWHDPATDTVHFRVWAPDRNALEAVLYAPDGATERRAVALARSADGFFTAALPDTPPGVLYKLRVDGAGPFPDPASRAQPFGVHGPSQVVSEDFPWTDSGWRGVSLEELVVYEVHVGTATPEGTFEALIARLPHVRALGATAIELLPVASFPGRRNWGYDGVSWYAPAAVYGGPGGLKRLVDAAHAHGLGVIMDVVYNHLGPDGNYLRCVSERYYHPKHSTPWGDGINLDGEDAAREVVLANAEMWVRDYHVDGLRLDATHSIQDSRSPHVLSEIAQRARAAAPDRTVLVIAEDDRNLARLMEPPAAGGEGMDAVWADDFQRQLWRVVVGDREGYYEDYSDRMEDVARALSQGWLFQGEWSSHWKYARGTEAARVSPPRMIHSLQNHDQVGNRALGERLGALVSPAVYRAMSALLLLSPYTPLIWMGQEWNASTPFLFFTDHHAELGRAVTEGRRREFEHYSAFTRDDVPDPQADETFLRSRLDWTEPARDAGRAGVLELYRTLLFLRREHPALRERARGSYEARVLGENGLELVRRGGGRALRLVCALRGGVSAEVPAVPREIVLYTEEKKFGGRGEGLSVRAAEVSLAGPGAVLLEER